MTNQGKRGEAAPVDDRPETREVLTAKIAAEAAESLRSFCARHGVSATAAFEIGGRELAEETIPPSLEYRRYVVRRAREIDNLRRSRKPSPGSAKGAASPESRTDSSGKAPAWARSDDADQREVLSVKLSAHAAEGWRSFSARNGITLTALLEVVCWDLGQGVLPPTQEARDRLVGRAREVDIARRSRSR